MSSLPKGFVKPIPPMGDPPEDPLISELIEYCYGGLDPQTRSEISAELKISTELKIIHEGVRLFKKRFDLKTAEAHKEKFRIYCNENWKLVQRAINERVLDQFTKNEGVNDFSNGSKQN